MSIVELETPLEGTNYTVLRYVEFTDIHGYTWRVEEGTWHDEDVVAEHCLRTIRMTESKNGGQKRLVFGGAPILNPDATVKELQAKILLLGNR